MAVAAPTRPARAWEKKAEGRRKGLAYPLTGAPADGPGGPQPHGGPTFEVEDEVDDSLQQFTCKTDGCPAMKIFVKSNGYCVQCNLLHKEAGGGTDNHLSEVYVAEADVAAKAYDEPRRDSARRTFNVPRGQYEKASFTTYGTME